MILVSHDRNFLSGLTDRVIEFSNRKIREYPGDIDNYLDQQEFILDIPVKKKKKNVVLYKQKKELDKQLRFLKKQNNNIESEITKIENEIKDFNALLSEVNKKGTSNKQIDYNDYNRLNDLLNILISFSIFVISLSIFLVCFFRNRNCLSNSFFCLYKTTLLLFFFTGISNMTSS